jgi:hypothetical protein
MDKDDERARKQASAIRWRGGKARDVRMARWQDGDDDGDGGLVVVGVEEAVATSEKRDQHATQAGLTW